MSFTSSNAADTRELTCTPQAHPTHLSVFFQLGLYLDFLGQKHMIPEQAHNQDWWCTCAFAKDSCGTALQAVERWVHRS